MATRTTLYTGILTDVLLGRVDALEARQEMALFVADWNELGIAVSGPTYDRFCRALAVLARWAGQSTRETMDDLEEDARGIAAGRRGEF